MGCGVHGVMQVGKMAAWWRKVKGQLSSPGFGLKMAFEAQNAILDTTFWDTKKESSVSVEKCLPHVGRKEMRHLL